MANGNETGQQRIISDAERRSCAFSVRALDNSMLRCRDSAEEAAGDLDSEPDDATAARYMQAAATFALAAQVAEVRGAIADLRDGVKLLEIETSAALVGLGADLTGTLETVATAVEGTLTAAADQFRDDLTGTLAAMRGV